MSCIFLCSHSQMGSQMSVAISTQTHTPLNTSQAVQGSSKVSYLHIHSLPIQSTLLMVVHSQDAIGEEVLNCLHTHPKELSFFSLVSKEGMGHALIATGIQRGCICHYPVMNNLENLMPSLSLCVDTVIASSNSIVGLQTKTTINSKNIVALQATSNLIGSETSNKNKNKYKWRNQIYHCYFCNLQFQ